VIFHGAFPDLDWERRDYSHVPAVVEALAGRQGVWTGFPSPVTGEPRIGAMVPVPGLGWAVGFLQPVERAMAPARRQLRFAVGTAAVGLGLGVALAVLLGAWLSRPMGALAAGVHALAEGDLAHRIPVRWRNEFGWLADAFNRMAARLEAARRQERQLNDELTIANEELQANAVRLDESLAELEGARRRAMLLADASAELSRSLDYETTVSNVARLAVPDLADWCFVDLDEGAGATRRLAIAHAAPSAEALAAELRAVSFELDGPHPVAKVIRTGQAEIVPEVTEGWLAGIARDEPHLAKLRALAPTSYMFVPLRARSRTLGTITFTATGSRRYGAGDLPLAEELARRAALVIDNARLYTELKEAKGALRSSEEQLRQAQKMEAVGRLAGGVAHDFNNLLTAITGYSELLAERLGDGPAGKDVEEIRKAAARAAALTRQLLAFGRQQVLQPRVLDLNAVVLDVEKMLRMREDIDLVSLPGSGLGCVEADPGQLEQVILNLAINARDAMPVGGTLTIETANAELDEAYARQHVSVRPGSYVMLAVSDTGLGMDAETQARIFEPFFTTKELGKGTGLGLSTVYGIVKQSGGNIWVYSEVGRGTTFKVYLPRVEAPLEPRARAAARSGATRGTETVLLVENDPGVRALAGRVLHEHGYTVLEARDCDEALRVGRGHEGEIALVLTDLVMPSASGPDVAEELTALRPGVKLVFMSGYTENAAFRQRGLEPGTAFLDKPFTPAALAQKVREVLDAAGER
jgi:signal transduction histidine kinase/CheY-like chemotaxis protein